MRNFQKFFTLIFSLLIMVAWSCSEPNENDLETDIAAKTPGELSIILNSPQTLRSTGYGDNDYVESRLYNALVYAFNANGEINASRYAAFSEGQETKITLSTQVGSNLIYIVANVNEADFENVTNLETFKAVTLTLSQSIIPFIGQSTINVLPEIVNNATIQVHRMISKVALIKVENKLTEGGLAGAQLLIDKVFLHPGYTKSDLIFTTSEPKSGLSFADFINAKVDYFDPYTRHWFYTFPGEVRLVIGAYVKQGDRPAEYYYYPVTINAVYNNAYSINVRIFGIGVTDPDDNMDSVGKLQLTVETVPWTNESKDVDF